MSDLGKARTATHKDLSKAFGGLLTRNESPAPTPPNEDEDAIMQPVATAEPSTTDTLSLAEPGPKPAKRSQRKVATSKETASPAPVRELVPATAAPVANPEPVSAAEAAPDDRSDQPVQISLPVSVNARLTAFKKKTGLSHPNILFDAIESTAEQLPVLVKAKTVQLGTSTGTALFSRPQTAAKRDTSSEPRESFIIRITKQNKGVLDTLAKQVNAPNRTVLIVAAYDAYLPELPTE